ncbi:MAG: PaaI family thioesterase [Pikeienuella sp.]
MSAAPTQDEKARRDAALKRLTQVSPYHRFINVEFERMGDELTGRLNYDWNLIGNPVLPALHGGVVAALLEITALTQLGWGRIWAEFEAGGERAAAIESDALPKHPKTIDLSVDYLRSGRPRDVYARAYIQKQGRRVANVRVEAWQDARDRPIAAAHGHFLMPDAE